MDRIRHLASAELVSAERGHGAPRASMMDLVALLSLRDWETAAVFVHENRELVEKSGVDGGSLHLLAKRGDAGAVKWLLDHGANPNARWPHWDAEVTPPLQTGGDRGDSRERGIVRVSGPDLCGPRNRLLLAARPMMWFSDVAVRFQQAAGVELSVRGFSPPRCHVSSS